LTVVRPLPASSTAADAVSLAVSVNAVPVSGSGQAMAAWPLGSS
jgi:hypothetical protein